MSGIEKTRTRTRSIASLALLPALLAVLAVAPVPVTRAAGEKPVVTKAVFFWMHEPDPTEPGTNLWSMHLNVSGTDADSAILKSRILILDRSGAQRVVVTNDTYEWANPNNVPPDQAEPLLSFVDNLTAEIDQFVTGEVTMWLEDFDGNVSEVVTLPITSTQKRGDEAAIGDVTTSPGGKIVVSGVNLTAQSKVTINKARVAQRALTYAADGTSVQIDVASSGLEPAAGYRIRVGAGKRRSNPAFVRP